MPRISQVRTTVRSVSIAATTSASVTPAARARMPSLDAGVSCACTAVVIAVAASGPAHGRSAKPVAGAALAHQGVAGGHRTSVAPGTDSAGAQPARVRIEECCRHRLVDATGACVSC